MLAFAVSTMLGVPHPPQLSLLLFPQVRPGSLQGGLHQTLWHQMLQMLPPDHTIRLDQESS